jgi:hypothetical protein
MSDIESNFLGESMVKYLNVRMASTIVSQLVQGSY